MMLMKGVTLRGAKACLRKGRGIQSEENRLTTCFGILTEPTRRKQKSRKGRAGALDENNKQLSRWEERERDGEMAIRHAQRLY